MSPRPRSKPAKEPRRCWSRCHRFVGLGLCARFTGPLLDGRHPAPSADIGRGYASGGAHIPLQDACPRTCLRQPLVVLRVTPLPTGEPLVHRSKSLGGPLVGVGDHSFLERRSTRPDPPVIVIRQSAHRVSIHGRRELREPVAPEPLSAGMAVTEREQGIALRQSLIHVVQEGRALRQPTVDLDAALRDACSQVGSDLRDGRRVAHEAGGRPQADEDGERFAP